MEPFTSIKVDVPPDHQAAVVMLSSGAWHIKVSRNGIGGDEIGIGVERVSESGVERVGGGVVEHVNVEETDESRRGLKRDSLGRPLGLHSLGISPTFSVNLERIVVVPVVSRYNCSYAWGCNETFVALHVVGPPDKAKERLTGNSLMLPGRWITLYLPNIPYAQMPKKYVNGPGEFYMHRKAVGCNIELIRRHHPERFPGPRGFSNS